MIYEFDTTIKIADEAVSITISYEHARTCDDLWITRIVTEDAIDLTNLKHTAVGDRLIKLCVEHYESVCEDPEALFGTRPHPNTIVVSCDESKPVHMRYKATQGSCHGYAATQEGAIEAVKAAVNEAKAFGEEI